MWNQPPDVGVHECSKSFSVRHYFAIWNIKLPFGRTEQNAAVIKHEKCSSFTTCSIKNKIAPYSITERRVPELIPVLGSQPAGDMSHKPGGRVQLLSAGPAVTLATLKRAATSFAAGWTEARWVWTVCLRLLPDSFAAAIWTRALQHLRPAR